MQVGAWIRISPSSARVMVSSGQISMAKGSPLTLMATPELVSVRP